MLTPCELLTKIEIASRITRQSFLIGITTMHKLSDRQLELLTPLSRKMRAKFLRFFYTDLELFTLVNRYNPTMDNIRDWQIVECD